MRHNGRERTNVCWRVWSQSIGPIILIYIVLYFGLSKWKLILFFLLFVLVISEPTVATFSAYRVSYAPVYKRDKSHLMHVLHASPSGIGGRNENSFFCAEGMLIGTFAALFDVFKCNVVLFSFWECTIWPFNMNNYILPL